MSHFYIRVDFCPIFVHIAQKYIQYITAVSWLSAHIFYMYIRTVSHEMFKYRWVLPVFGNNIYFTFGIEKHDFSQIVFEVVFIKIFVQYDIWFCSQLLPYDFFYYTFDAEHDKDWYNTPKYNLHNYFLSLRCFLYNMLLIFFGENKHFV